MGGDRSGEAGGPQVKAAPALLLLVLAACSRDPVQGAGLCTGHETTFFACDTRQKKAIAICGSPPGTVQYRFGRPNAVELRFPEDASQGARKLLYAHHFRAQAERTEISFSNNGVDYAVFDHAEDGKRRAGVRVTTGGKDVEVLCAGPVTSRLGALEKQLPCDKDNALNGNACR